MTLMKLRLRFLVKNLKAFTTMSAPDPESDPEEAITQEEIAGTAPAPASSTSGVAVTHGAKRNAFQELMASKPKKPVPQTLASTRADYTGALTLRDGLSAYTQNPLSHPTGRVIYHNSNFVAINDLYPKSSVHTLLLPISPLSRYHPFEAFTDPSFLSLVQAETLNLKSLVAKELQRRYGHYSAQDRLRESVLNEEIPWPSTKALPEGRNWVKDLLVGIHAHPSMNDLHVHVLSPDMYSECLKHKKHYLSFNTPFLIDVKDFPLADDDPRLHPGKAGYLDAELVCWRCRQSWGKSFKKFKAHLAEEFEAWKKE
ncbi:HIT domain-containing protein [Xylariaceae sp. FL1019]|nr:HIT domain-containing protein [Xylariaceae sp. FL1019]